MVPQFGPTTEGSSNEALQSAPHKGQPFKQLHYLKNPRRQCILKLKSWGNPRHGQAKLIVRLSGFVLAKLIQGNPKEIRRLTYPPWVAHIPVPYARNFKE